MRISFSEKFEQMFCEIIIKKGKSNKKVKKCRRMKILIFSKSFQKNWQNIDK